MALQLAVTVTAGAQDPLRALFPEHPSGYVTDLTGVLAPEPRGNLTREITALRQRTGAELAVVVLPTIGGYAPVDVAVAIGRVWGVGAAAELGDPRRNAGIVILLVPRREEDANSGHVFIAVGTGLEGIVTDAAAGRIRDRMLPALSRGDYAEGLRTGVAALSELIDRRLDVPGPVEVPREPGRSLLTFAVLSLLLIVVVGLIARAAAARRGTPRARRRRRRWHDDWWIGGGGFGGWTGGSFGGSGGGGFGGFGGGGGFSGGGAGGRF